MSVESMHFKRHVIALLKAIHERGCLGHPLVANKPRWCDTVNMLFIYYSHYHLQSVRESGTKSTLGKTCKDHLEAAVAVASSSSLAISGLSIVERSSNQYKSRSHVSYLRLPQKIPFRSFPPFRRTLRFSYHYHAYLEGSVLPYLAC